MAVTTLRERGARLAVFWIVAAATYFAIPLITPFTVRAIPLTPLDTGLPFVPLAIVIYVTLYPHHIASFFSASRPIALRSLFWAYLWGVGLTSVAYFFLPFIHPAPHAVEGGVSVFHALTAFVKGVDPNLNLFPSGHVFFSMMPAVFFLTAGERRKGLWFGVWALAIFASTLLLRQHGIVDAGTGLLLAFVVGIIFGFRAQHPRSSTARTAPF